MDQNLENRWPSELDEPLDCFWMDVFEGEHPLAAAARAAKRICEDAANGFYPAWYASWRLHLELAGALGAGISWLRLWPAVLAWAVESERMRVVLRHAEWPVERDRLAMNIPETMGEQREERQEDTRG